MAEELLAFAKPPPDLDHIADHAFAEVANRLCVISQNGGVRLFLVWQGWEFARVCKVAARHDDPFFQPPCRRPGCYYGLEENRNFAQLAGSEPGIMGSYAQCLHIRHT